MPETVTFWETKIAAFLHDTPSKATDIAGHYERAAAAMVRACLSDEAAFDHSADHTAAAADRVPFPRNQIKCSFDGSEGNPFRHPLDGTRTHPFDVPFQSANLAEETEQVTQPNAFTMPAGWPDAEQARAKFFMHWRLWQKHAVERDHRFAFIPADTRIPDHTIWNHVAVTSAMATAGSTPAFLKFHLSPVQPFIASARSTRDLWSGSFLISWLMMTGLKRLSELTGPDAVIFPNLYGQPLFDVMWKKELWDCIKTADGATSIWESFTHAKDSLTTPNLPNVFLALVPSAQAAELAQEVETAIRDEWQRIAEAVLKAVSGVDENLFRAQVAAHWTISWQTTPWPATLDETEKICAALPEKDILDRFQKFRNLFEVEMPVKHRDRRYYTDDTKTTLNNVGAAWSLLVALNAWQLDAVRHTGVFDKWPGGPDAKDALNGREEGLTSGENIEDWGDHKEPAGATTIIKRLWHEAYLRSEWSDVFTNNRFFSMPNTVKVAGSASSYFAILALDGDDMGKFVSGAKAPPLLSQLAPPAQEYFEGYECAKRLQRPLHPSYHLQFSQALSNFALHVVPGIIREYDGHLLYAGGDDVLAMLPAANALACADALQKAFAQPFGTTGYDDSGKPIDIILPGATASVGISLCHERSPLQDAVRAAQANEKRAKRLSAQKNAFAVSVFKRSGEISEWEARFAGGAAVAALQAILNGMAEEVISAKFPHKLLELVAPFQADRVEDADEFPVKEVFLADLAMAIDRQRGKKWNRDGGEAIREAIEAYLDTLEGEPSEVLRHLTGLLTVAAFLARQQGEPS